MQPLVGLSIMHEPEFLQASLPLFQSSQVDVIEWSFDTIRYEKYKPKWLHQLLTEYSRNKRLIGHGVRYSLFDAKWGRRQTVWLNQLKKEVKKYRYNHISEHFGFMSSADFHKGAPLPVPLNKNTLQIGINRLRKLQEASQLPVGIENLAFSFCLDDVKKQGEFINRLISPVKGFVILDLHNVYCQAINFNVDIKEIIAFYPLHKVKEIHISGGSWQKSVYAKNIKSVRRDTHDEKVPADLFAILEWALKKCPYLEYVIFERLGHTLTDVKEQEQFRKDFLKIKKIVSESQTNFSKKTILPKAKINYPVFTDKLLFRQQQIILKTLKENKNPYRAIDELQNNTLLNKWHISDWNPSMVETAISLIEKWG